MSATFSEKSRTGCPSSLFPCSGRVGGGNKSKEQDSRGEWGSRGSTEEITRRNGVIVPRFSRVISYVPLKEAALSATGGATKRMSLEFRELCRIHEMHVISSPG